MLPTNNFFILFPFLQTNLTQTSIGERARTFLESPSAAAKLRRHLRTKQRRFVPTRRVHYFCWPPEPRPRLEPLPDNRVCPPERQLPAEVWRFVLHYKIPAR